jgi:hypothetical protein
MKDVTKKNGGCGCGGSSGGCGCGGGCTCGSVLVQSQSCGVTTMVRPRFFPGQLLVDGDLQLLVDYTSLKSRLHNRFLHGAGVVCGLQVGCHPCGGGKVVVGPGMALDCCGNDIIVPCPVELDINAMIRELSLSLQPGYDCGDPCAEDADEDDPRKNTTSYCLWVRYCEELTDLMAPYMSDDHCSAQTCQASRVREGYSFELRCRDEDEPPETVFDRIRCCIGDLELADRAADDANALSYFSDQTAFASAQVRAKAPVPFDATDVEALRDGTQRLQSFIQTTGPANTKQPSDIEVRRGLDALQWTAAAVVRWDLQTGQSREELGATLPDAGEAVTAGRAAVQAAAPVLATAANAQITSARDRVLARESTAQALRWTAQDVAFPEAEAVQRQYFAYNAWYSTSALSAMSDAMTQLRDWLLEAINKRGLFGDCKLRDDVLAIKIPPPNSPDTTRRVSVRLVSAFLRYLVDCICAALNPPCQPCHDLGVKLACVDVKNCEVVKICNLERTYVLTGLAFRYWIPFLHQIGELFERACCRFALDLDRPPAPEADPHVPGDWADRTTTYYSQTAPASRVLDAQPAIPTLLRLVRVTPETARSVTDFGGSMASLLMNEPTLDLQRRIDTFRGIQLPRLRRAERVEEDVTSTLRERVGVLNKEVRDLKQRLSRMEKNR